MGATNVDLDRLEAALHDYGFAYLLTVGDDYHVHTVTVEPVLRGGVVEVGLIGGVPAKPHQPRRGHSALAPREPGGYSLIVDGRARITGSDDETVQLAITPTRALLHRNADPNSAAAAKGCLHDCVVLSGR